MIYFVFLVLAGVFQGFMISLNGQLGNYYSLFAICFFVHAIAGVFLYLYIKFKEKKPITFRGVPKYVYAVGFMGVIMVSTSSWCTLHIGATAMLSLSVIGQMTSSAIVDHYGWFNSTKKPFRLKQLPCYLLVLVGVLIVVYG
ncbi:DMT family transporter [Anaerotignum sp. MB30-C6]|uniref:DMT family transporter n=1 Tax=Anaerotignum sp. MB30-C6 TaxID=3070814 RepID=UPI0027DBBFF2|nr:DMT family transporter [Anaerotignum sp. MB30-C6]WMI80105.1 DMT family transporter [Anaerotignum sp. MB30-C6]